MELGFIGLDVAGAPVARRRGAGHGASGTRRSGRPNGVDGRELVAPGAGGA